MNPLKSIFTAFTATIFVYLFLFSYQIYGQQTSNQLTGFGSVRGFLEYVPPGYNDNTDLYPVLIFLHGSGERGDGSNLDLEKVKTHGPPKLINNGHNMCFNNQGVEECFIVLSPQQGISQFGWNNDVIPFVDYALANYRIDPDRVYLTGLSMGGDGCWDGMRSNNNIPNRFAAVAPIAGKGMSSEGCTAGQRKITIWAFHGNADTSTSINSHIQAINGYISCKEESVPDPTFTEYDGVGHAGAWQNAYRTDNSLHSPNLYEWFLAQNKSQGNCTTITSYTATGWDNGLPDATKEAIIAESYDTVDGNLTACSLTVATGATLTVGADEYISVENDITVDGILQVEHQGSVVQINDDASVTNNGTIDVAVNTPTLTTADFMILGSPMSGETREDVWTAAFNVQQYTTANFVPNVAVGASGVLYNFSSENIDDWNAYITGALTAGEGFLVFPQTSLSAPGGVFTYNYNTGTLNNGVVTRPLGYNTTAADSPNMLSNPYPSGIDAAAFLAANPQIDAAYFWDHLSAPSPMEPGPYTNNYDMDDISVINSMGPVAAANGGTAPTGVIATAQGFGVFASAAGTATFNNSMRVTTGNTTLRSAEVTDDRNRFWLQVKSEAYGVGSNALVGFTENATADYDAGYDSPRLTTIVSLHSNIEGDMENGYIIQGREAFNANMKIPFSFSTGIDENTAYRISLSDFDGDTWNTTTIYLIDHITGVITNLSENEYVFNSEMGNFKGRFSIQFRDTSLGTNDINLNAISLYPNPTPAMIDIVSPRALVSGIVVTDIQGRVVENISIDSVNNYQLNLSQLESAVYFISVTTDAGSITKRIIKK